MESQKINILLQKYFDAESTLDEENELITYFNSGEVEDELKPYIPVFSGMKEISAEENPELGDELMNYILESEHKEKVRYRWMWQMVTGVAASILLVMMAVNFYSERNEWNDTFDDPQQAYVEASKALEFVAGKYNKGLAQLKPIGKMEEAATPLYSGMETLNKGMNELQNIGSINEKIKKQ
ncbi:MAG TPA: hypothetical protein VFG54_13055 [Prolixibacteraceae bacterium]|nr:hypothetical protein [Prolixibacteraceae bacterium]